jgi:hypothetical protein
VTEVGRCFQPALPMNRARILGLGLAVGIAIAGCSSAPAAPPTDNVEWDTCSMRGLSFSGSWSTWKIRDEEIGRASYEEVLEMRKCAPALRPLIRKALTDGRITYGEYQSLEEADFAQRRDQHGREDKAEAERIKRQLVQEWR